MIVYNDTNAIHSSRKGLIHELPKSVLQQHPITVYTDAHLLKSGEWFPARQPDIRHLIKATLIQDWGPGTRNHTKNHYPTAKLPTYTLRNGLHHDRRYEAVKVTYDRWCNGIEADHYWIVWKETCKTESDPRDVDHPRTGYTRLAWPKYTRDKPLVPI